MNTSQPENSNTDVEIGERVSEALIIKRVSVKTLAAELGIGYTTMRKTLAGERSFTISQLGQIANRLKVQTASLLPDELAVRNAA